MAMPPRTNPPAARSSAPELMPVRTSLNGVTAAGLGAVTGTGGIDRGGVIVLGGAGGRGGATVLGGGGVLVLGGGLGAATTVMGASATSVAPDS